ncbi:hypothetical protein CKM354_000641000 [Cercospora kikuchii]|uniref:Uncharacterized protein n=1 Tax=Cercospora kikuchii TaxID=84275 RepID=A0A9P3FGH1_9PEZI|nr:uncharacterized protein CKM354_000641000 [Cercospora kikuchii]GIZ43172.1 hypothetical protein CKM354_000641000 [Cercospora kikuchii]
MAMDIEQHSRNIIHNMSKGDIVAGLGLATILSGSRIGLSLAVMRSVFHTVRRSSFRPSFPHTTGLVAFTITASQSALALDRHVTGNRETFEEIKSRTRNPDKTQSDLTSEQAKLLTILRVHITLHAVCFLFGAGWVAFRPGIHGRNIFRTIGGGCIGLQLYAAPQQLLANNHRIANPDLSRG